MNEAIRTSNWFYASIVTGTLILTTLALWSWKLDNRRLVRPKDVLSTRIATSKVIYHDDQPLWKQPNRLGTPGRPVALPIGTNLIPSINTVTRQAARPIIPTKPEVPQPPRPATTNGISSTDGDKSANKAETKPARGPARSKILLSAQKFVSDEPVIEPREPSRPEKSQPLDDRQVADDQQMNSQWPEPVALMQQIGQLVKHPETETWARRAIRNLHKLRELRSLAEPEASAPLGHLEGLVGQVPEIAARLDTPKNRRAFKRTGYAMERRLAIWRLAHENSMKPARTVLGANRLSDALDDVEQMLSDETHGQSWRRFLLLNELSSSVSDVDQIRRLANKVFYRIETGELDERQSEFLQERAIQGLLDELLFWADSTSITIRSFLASIEKYEASATEAHANRLIEQWNQLNRGPHRNLAERFNQHYRNANIRLAMTSKFLNRALPSVEPASEEVNEQILGARVTGKSLINTRLGVDLIPDSNQLRLQLNASGTVESHTTSKKGWLTVIGRNNSSYKAKKWLMLGPDGLRISGATADVSSRIDVDEMQTDYDAIPPIGYFLRTLAESQSAEERRETRLEVENRVERRVTIRIDQEVGQRIGRVTERVKTNLVDRLDGLQLKPVSIQLRTREDRVIARWRVATDLQLASYTPRPMPTERSLVNYQIHQSAVRNVVNQFSLGRRAWNIADLRDEILGKIGVSPATSKESLPRDITVTLAATDGIDVRFDEGAVKVTLQIKRLSNARRSWQNLTVFANYLPRIDGLRAELVRGGVVKLKGQRYIGFGDQIVLRGIFTKFFSSNRTCPVIHPRLVEDERFAGLCVSQFEIRDGWIGISLGETPDSDPRIVRTRSDSRR